MASEKISIKKLPEKILIIKPSSLGDVIHSLPLLNTIKNHFEKTEIHWVIAKGLEGIFENHPMINKLWVINKDDWKRLGKIRVTLSEIQKLYKDLKDESYDITIDLQGLFRSGFLTYATHSPLRIGFKEARELSSLFYTVKVEGGENIHAVDRYLKIAEAMGCTVEDVLFPLPLIFESSLVKQIKSLMKDYIVLVPTARWKTKQWPAIKFAKIASLLSHKSVIIGSNADKEISEYIEENSGGKALSLAGKTTIADLISLIRGAKFVIANDSGPMHLAVACGIPVIAIFGPTNPILTGPYGNNKHIVLKSDLSCSPCYKRECSTIRCLDSISIDDVLKAIEKLPL
ncbi:MAG: lipopolysaccharide heptosyltransferase II [Thermodesulfovibrionales bacterium]|nr:lipopolysaccharide heptosyltransferase II [Thermodesulfovibrionales bacterium]